MMNVRVCVESELNFELYEGDCLDVIKTRYDLTGRVDLILCDLPFGQMKDIGENDGKYKNGMLGKFDWDTAIDLEVFFPQCQRLLRESGRLILFGTQPFTTTLINQSTYNLEYSFSLIWEKTHFANAFQAKRAPLNFFEDIVVFTKRYDTDNMNPLRGYFLWLKQHIGLSKAQLILKLGQRIDHTFRTDSTQFKLCTEEAYQDLTDMFKIKDNPRYKTYRELQKINDQYKQTFNLKPHESFKSNILKYERDSEKLHPTQKPVPLLNDLIYTFSNENDLVCDFTMGSGSTGVAALNLNRRFLGCELDPEFYQIAKDRLDKFI